MGRQVTTRFILQIKLILGFYYPFRVIHVTGATRTFGIGARCDGGVGVGVGNFDTLAVHLFCFTLQSFPEMSAVPWLYLIPG